MPPKNTFRAMFEPATYPPPKLDGIALAWRYSVAFLFYAVMAALYLSSARSSHWGGAGSIAVDVETGAAPMPVWAVVLDLVLGLVGLATVHLRRRWPLGYAVVTMALTPLASTLGLIATWAALSLATRRDIPKVLVLAGVAVATTVASFFVPWLPQIVSPAASVLSGVLAWGAVLLAGLYLGVRRDRAASLQARAELADRDREFAVLAERNRIAREMHDVLAHRISLVSMHAGVLAYRKDLPPEKTREIAGIIQENAHASLTELRTVLSSLREAPAEGGPEAPQPTLADLDALVAEARASGQQVGLELDIDVRAVAPVLARHCYRIVQEGLTNARKHAAGAPVTVRLEGRPRSGITIAVTNPLVTEEPAVPGAHLGIIGVTERAHMLGGRLEAGPRGGDFVLEAWLPWVG